jgi:hypothetical protein
VSAPPIPSSPADLELIAQLKSQLQYAELRIRVLEERLRLMRIEKYGAGAIVSCLPTKPGVIFRLNGYSVIKQVFCVRHAPARAAIR